MAKKQKKKILTREQKQAKILKLYATFVRKNKRNPTEADLQKLGVTRNTVRHLFETVRDMKEAAREAYPKVFENIIDETLFNKKNFAKIEESAAKYNRFVVTCAVGGAPVHEKFLKSLNSYCEKNNAKLLVIPVKDPASKAVNGNNVGFELDSKIPNDSLVFGDLALNSNIYISGIMMSAKQIDPTTGLGRIGRDCSFIFGSPKQRMRPIANQKHKLPHVSMGTGAITVPTYDTDRYMSQRTAYLADYDHKMGAIIVEIDANDHYHFRQIQAEPKSGNFVDLGDYYKPSGKVFRMDAEAIIAGDWHAGETDPIAKQATKEQAALLKPKYIFLHDVFNGKSISHHDRKKRITQAILAQEGLVKLDAELQITADEISEVQAWATHGCIIPYSNHDDFILRWLESGDWIKDRDNLKTASELTKAAIEGKMPCQFGIEKYMSPSAIRKTKWLKEDESYRLSRIECGAHGHLGPSGSRGSLANHEAQYHACNIGHSHTPGILRDAWQTGTNGPLDQGFNKGGSSWMQSNIVQYPNGSRQLLNSIKGMWRRKKK